MKPGRSLATLTSSALLRTKTPQWIKEVVAMYRTQRIWQQVPTRGQGLIALALVAALAFSAGAAFGAYGSRAYSFLTAGRQAVPPDSISSMVNDRMAQVLGPEDIAALPPQIQDQVRGLPQSGATDTMGARPRAHALGPEDIAALPPQIQDQVRGVPQASASENTTAREKVLSPEDFFTLPRQIQDQVRRGTHAGATNNAPAAREQMLGAEDILALPPHIQEQVRRAGSK